MTVEAVPDQLKSIKGAYWANAYIGRLAKNIEGSDDPPINMVLGDAFLTIPRLKTPFAIAVKLFKDKQRGNLAELDACYGIRDPDAEEHIETLIETYTAGAVLSCVALKALTEPAAEQSVGSTVIATDAVPDPLALRAGLKHIDQKKLAGLTAAVTKKLGSPTESGDLLDTFEEEYPAMFAFANSIGSFNAEATDLDLHVVTTATQAIYVSTLAAVDFTMQTATFS